MTYLYEKKIHFLKPDDIFCSLNQREYLDEKKIRELAGNISENGILEPLTVRPIKNGKFEIVCGKRRLAAAKIIGLRRVPCIVKKIDEKTSAIYTLSENIYRENPNFFEEAQQIKNLISRFDMDIFTVSECIGISRSSLLSKLSLLKLDEESKDKIIRNNLTARHAKIILSVPEDKRNEAIEKLLEGTDDTEIIREIGEEFIYKESGINYEETKEKAPLIKTSIGDIRLVSNSITKMLATLKSSGFDAYQQRTENDKYIEYKIRIIKAKPESYKQLKLV